MHLNYVMKQLINGGSSWIPSKRKENKCTKMELQQTRHTDGHKASYQMIRNSVVKTQKTAISLKYSLPSIIKFDDIQP